MLYSVIFNNDQEYIVDSDNILNALIIAQKKVGHDIIAVGLTNFQGYLSKESEDVKAIWRLWDM